MPESKLIPEIPFKNRQRKAIEFEVFSSSDWLNKIIPPQHDPSQPHRVAFYVILYILDGEGTHYIDFKAYPYKKGSLIFISKEQVHAFPKTSSLNAIFILFTENFLNKIMLASPLIQQLRLYNYHLSNPVLQLTAKEINTFSDLIFNIKAEYEAPDDFATEEIILSSLKILLCLAERIRKTRQSTALPHFYMEDFLVFQGLLQTNLFKNRQVKFYADQLAISTKKLNRITQQIMQLSAKDYIIETLILEIKRLLMNTDLSIKEIAYKTGFDTPTNFVKFFKKQHFNTPSEFRKKHINSSLV